MSEITMVATARGLLQTAVEKILVLGQDDSKADVEKLREVLEDMLGFWNFDDKLLIDFDSTIAEVLMDKAVQTASECANDNGILRFLHLNTATEEGGSNR